MTDLLARGDKGIAVSLDFFFASAIANGAPLTFVYPDRLGFSPAHVGITASTERPEAAKAWVEFLLSRDGQSLLFHPDIRKLPVRPEVYRSAPAGYFDPFAMGADRVAYDPARHLARLPVLSALYDVAITDRQARLKTLWALVHQAEAEVQRRGSAELAAAAARARALAGSVPVSETAVLQGTFAPGSGPGDGRLPADALRWREQLQHNAAEAERWARAVLERAGRGGGS